MWLRTISEPSASRPFASHDRLRIGVDKSGQRFTGGYWVVGFCVCVLCFDFFIMVSLALGPL